MRKQMTRRRNRHGAGVQCPENRPMKRCVEARETVAPSTTYTIRLIELSAAVAVTHVQQRCGVDRKQLPLGARDILSRAAAQSPARQSGAVWVFEIMSRN